MLLAACVRLESLGEVVPEPAEATRAESISNAGRRRQFLAGRAVLRSLLAELPGHDGNTSISVEAGQAPRILTRPDLYLSVSHSDDLVAAAVSNAPVGVDVQHCRADRPFADLARRIMSEVEWQAWLSLPKEEQPAAFYRSWCGKEAAYKACLGSSLRSLELRPCQDADLRCWALSAADVATAGGAFLAIGSPQLEALQWRHDTGLLCGSEWRYRVAPDEVPVVD